LKYFVTDISQYLSAQPALVFHHVHPHNLGMSSSKNFTSAKKVYIKTYGCQMNEYDSSRMADLLQATEGMESTDNPEDADVILLNTCSIREKAQEKVFSQLGVFAPLKAQKPELVIGVGGCVASQEGSNIVARAPYVDVVFGPQTLHRLPQMIRNQRTTQLPQVDISFPEIEKFDNLPPPRVCASKRTFPAPRSSGWSRTTVRPRKSLLPHRA
jgi:tRNA A37 methylthiotransferase MiaB